MRLRQTAGQRTERDKAVGLADSHHRMSSCSQKDLSSLTVMDEQCRRVISPPRWKSRPRGGLGLALSFRVQLSQALRKGYRVEGREYREVDLSPETV